MHLALAIERAIIKWPHKDEIERLSKQPLESLLLSAPTWVHEAVNFAARIAAMWPEVQQFAPALANTKKRQLAKLLVPSNWPIE